MHSVLHVFSPEILVLLPLLLLLPLPPPRSIVNTQATVEWFRIYKIPAGKPENRFAFNGEAKDKSFAMSVIREARAQWQKLNAGETVHAKIEPNGTTTGTAAISQDEAKAIVAATPAATEDAPLDPSVNQWHYITL